MTKWDYDVAPASTRGTMRCASCGKQIEQGDYRYRLKESGYVTQHRVCTLDDAAWGRIDRKRNRAAELETERRAAFDEFVSLYGIPDDLIEELRDQS